MCAACVAEGSMYVGGAVVSLRVLAHRASSRRALGLLPAPGAARGAAREASTDDDPELSTGTPHL